MNIPHALVIYLADERRADVRRRARVAGHRALIRSTRTTAKESSS